MYMVVNYQNTIHLFGAYEDIRQGGLQPPNNEIRIALSVKKRYVASNRMVLSSYFSAGVHEPSGIDFRRTLGRKSEFGFVRVDAVGRAVGHGVADGRAKRRGIESGIGRDGIVF